MALEGAAVAEATPVSSDPVTAAIETSIADLDHGDDDGGESTEGEPAQADSAAPATQETPSGDRPVEPEIRGRLSAKRHQEILTRQREKQAAEHAQAVKEYQDRLAAYDSPETRARLQLIELAERDPDAFAAALLQSPAYAGRLTLKQKADAQAEKSNGRKDLGEMPGPNRVSEDGQLQFYDAEGLAQRDAWLVARSMQDAEERFAKQLAERLGPIEHERAAKEKFAEVHSKVSKELAHARTNWPLFTEHEADIKALVTGDAPVKLLEGYATTVIPKLQAQIAKSREDYWKEFQAELNTTAAATGERPDAGPAARGTASGSSDPVTDAIRKSISRIRTVA